MNKVLFTLLLSFTLLSSTFSQVQLTFGSDTISAPGGMVDVDVIVSGFENIAILQLSLNWDASVFSFESIENITDTLPEFGIGNIGTPDNAVVVEDGELILSWSRGTTEPESIPDGTVLFTLRLNGVGALCGSTAVTLSNLPRGIEVIDADFNEVDISATGGAIDIYDPSCEMTGGSDLSFTVESVSASGGSNICIPVTADNFTDIFSFQTGIEWDPAVLRFTGIMDAGLQSIVTNDASAAQGNVNLVWVFDQIGVTVANGATLFEICFEVIGNTGQTSGVSLVNLPNVEIEVGLEEGTIDNFDINNAAFTVGSGGGTDGVGLIASDIFTENNNPVCIPITTRNFTGVAAFQAGVSFDPAVFGYSSIMSRALTVEVGGGAAAQGELRLLWQADINTPSVTLDDDVVLFELCFDVVGADGARSEIGFVNLPSFGVEFSGEIGNLLDFFVQDGSITVGTPMNTGDVTLTVSSASVNRGQDVCVDITATGFTDIEGMGYALQWDPTVLSYVEVRNFNLPNLGTSAFSTIDDNKLALIWTPPSSQTVADGTSLFQVCFTAVDPCGSTTSSDISFERGNTPIEIIRDEVAIPNPQLNSGAISIANCDTMSGDLSINILSISHPSCSGNTNGIVSVDFTGASGAVMCLWTRDSDGLQITANCNLLGVPGGTYSLEASDQAGNMATVRATLVDPSVVVVEGDIINGSCTGTGEIALRVSGGTSASGAYTYSWSSDLPSTSTVTGLEPGTYRVSVSDDNQCTIVRDFVVTDNSFPLNPIVTDETDMIMPNGSISLNPDGGVDLSYLWSTGDTTSSINGLSAGTYSVTLTDNVGMCSTEQSYMVSSGFISGTSLIDDVISRYNGFGVSCNGESDGVLDGDINGGCSDGPVVITLDGSTVTLPVNNLGAGDHTLRLEDACGSIFEESFTIVEPDAITLNRLLNHNCPTGNQSDGSVELDLQGGTGVYTLMPSLGNSGMGTVIENLPLESFTVIVEDENTCQVMFENIGIDENLCSPDVGLCEGRTIISPNGDNVNDNFLIPCVNEAQGQPNSLTIYDRWGNLVMESFNYSNDWMGTDMSGDPLPEGGYMWVLTTGGAGSRDLFRGTVSILR